MTGGAMNAMALDVAPVPGLGSAARIGAVLGALSGAWLVALQLASAASGGMLWMVDAPAATVAVYPFLGALLGALGGPVLEVAITTGLWMLEP